MADQTPPGAKQRDGWDKIQLAVTLGLAVVAPYLSVKQYQLSERQAELNAQQTALKNAQDEILVRSQSHGITYAFADKIFDHLKDIGVKEASDKEQIVIDLLDIITETNTEDPADGDKPERRNRLLATPLRMALVTGNDEILVHIGSSAEKQAIWLGLAETSGSSVVRGTALRALGKLGRSLRADTDSAQLILLLEEIQLLGDAFQNEATLDSSVEAAGDVIRVMTKNPDRYRDEPVVRKSYDDLRGVTRVAVLQATEGAAGRASTSGGPGSAGLRRAQEVVNLFERSALRSVAPAPVADTPAGDAGKVGDLVKDLSSANAGVREQARTGLVTTGDAGVEALLTRLREQREDPRVRLGVASSLYRMPQPVALGPDAVAAVVQLIDDDDPAVRKYASEFLMKLYEPATVGAARDALTQMIARRPPTGAGEGANGAYNAVVILGTWSRTLPAEQTDARLAIRRQLEALQKDLARQPAWERTGVVIRELLGPPGTAPERAPGRAPRA